MLAHNPRASARTPREESKRLRRKFHRLRPQRLLRVRGSLPSSATLTPRKMSPRRWEVEGVEAEWG